MLETSLKKSLNRRQFHLSIFGLSLSGILTLVSAGSGCQSMFGRRRRKALQSGESCFGETLSAEQIPRRFYIANQRTDSRHSRSSQVASSQQSGANTQVTPRNVGVEGDCHPFVLEVIAEFNSRSHCNAVILPAVPQFNASSLGQTLPDALLQQPDRFDPGAVVEELLIIKVTEEILYRPMRLSAMLERRHVTDGVMISRQNRTWNAPTNDEPQGPSKLNLLLLNNPPPLHDTEQLELVRISPQAFQKYVAKQLVDEIIKAPLDAGAKLS